VDRVVLGSPLSAGRGKVSFQTLLRLELSEVATRRTESSPPKVAFILDSARELGWSVWDRSIRSTVNVPAFWPWPLDSFHAQVYNAIFVTNAAGALIISRAVAPVGWLTLGLAQEIFGLFAILGVVIIDGTSRRVDWELPATWLWLGFSRRYSLLDAMTWQAYAQRRMAALGARGSSVKA
jgi:hypothetical protein